MNPLEYYSPVQFRNRFRFRKHNFLLSGLYLGSDNRRVSENHVPWHPHWKTQDEMEESGLKDKNNHSKGTGGGAAKKLNTIDLAVQRFLREENPTLSRIPRVIFTKDNKAFTIAPLTLPFHQLQDDFKPSPEDILDLDLPSFSTKRAFTYDPFSGLLPYPDLPFKRSKKVVEPKEPSVVEKLHVAQLELIQLQLQITTYTIATHKKPETTEKAVKCDSFLDIYKDCRLL